MLFRQTLLYLPAQVLGPAFQFISIIAWTHFLTPADMGTFALVAAVQELAYVATTFWFTLYTMRYHDPNGEAAKRGAFLNTETMVLLAASVVSISVVFALPLFADIAWTRNLALAAVAYTVTRGLVTHLADRARTEHDTFTYSVFQISWPVLGLFIGLALVHAIERSAATVLWGYAVAQIVSLIVAGWRLDFGTRPAHYAPDAIQNALRYGLPLVIGGLLVWLANNGIRFVVEMKESAAAVGLITVGWGLGLRAAAFASMLVTAAAFPVAMQRARDGGMPEGQAQLERNGVLLLAALAPAAAGLYAISEPLVRMVVAQEFQDVTVAVLPLAIVAGALRNFRIHFGEQVFLLHERTMVPLWNDAIDAFASVAGGAIGLTLGGLPGAVAGAAVGSGISLAVTLVAAWVSYRFAMPLGALFRIALATAAMMVAVHSLPLAATVLSLAQAISVGAAVYSIVLLAVYPELAQKVLGLLRRGRPA